MNADAHEMLREHALGDSYRKIAKRRGLHSHEGVRQMVVAEERRVLGEISYDLVKAVKTEREGGVAVWPVILVPHQRQDGWQAAIAFLGWVVDKLRAMGATLDVQTRPTPAGNAFMIILIPNTDETDVPS